jgi:hypothetical protein
MPARDFDRRAFLRQAAAGAATVACGVPAAASVKGEIPLKRIIAGSPRERGRAYGRQFKDGIAAFLDKEIYAQFVGKPSPKDDMLRYAAACGKVVREVCPVVHDELEGVAEGSGLRLEELLLINLHEELYHRGVLPKVPHCTAVAVGPPDTAGTTLVGQTWDWMESVYGLSSVIEWRTGGVNVLAYGYPGMWAGAGLSSSGFALCWTSANLGEKALGARVGIPSYVLIAHLLYQGSLKDALAEAKRDKHAGWFTFVLGDNRGTLANIEGSPKGIHVERTKGRLARVGYGSRAMTGTPEGQPVVPHERCRKAFNHIATAGGRGLYDATAMQELFAEPACGICVGKGTIDMMVFDCTAAAAHLSRGPSYKVDWKTFTFGDTR